MKKTALFVLAIGIGFAPAVFADNQASAATSTPATSNLSYYLIDSDIHESTTPSEPVAVSGWGLSVNDPGASEFWEDNLSRGIRGEFSAKLLEDGVYSKTAESLPTHVSYCAVRLKQMTSDDHALLKLEWNTSVAAILKDPAPSQVPSMAKKIQSTQLVVVAHNPSTGSAREFLAPVDLGKLHISAYKIDPESISKMLTGQDDIDESASALYNDAADLKIPGKVKDALASSLLKYQGADLSNLRLLARFTLADGSQVSHLLSANDSVGKALGVQGFFHAIHYTDAMLALRNLSGASSGDPQVSTVDGLDAKEVAAMSLADPVDGGTRSGIFDK